MTSRIIRKPEILAPCGSYDILKAAINAGCDACYIGGSRFGARAYAENIDSDSIVKSIDYAHLHDVKLYLTVNTLFKDNEIEELYGFLKPYYEAGLDAVIVQDLGVFVLVRRLFPDLDVHISTQMNVTSRHAAAYLKNLGATRVVTAREMSLTEIKSIKDSVNIELEVFVHGAMCYSYSGQCLISSLAGGRSGNRGRCAQTCRKCYNNEYILSMKDMCSLAYVPELIELGVDSLKIEGRMKNEYYVASAVDAYKSVCEDYISGIYSEKKALALKEKLANIFNRGGFCDGYFVQSKGPDMISKIKPGNMGVKIGRVKKVQQGKLEINLSKDIFKQDVFEIVLKDSSSIEITSPAEGKKGDSIILNAPKTRLVNTGAYVYRTRCNALINEIENTIIKDNKRLNISFSFGARIGYKLSLTGSTIIGNKEFTETVYSDYIVEKSENCALDIVDVNKKLSQLNDTNWIIDKVMFDADDMAFVPAGEIKRIRRRLIEVIDQRIVSSYRRNVDYISVESSDNTTKSGFAGLKVSVTTVEQLAEVSKSDIIYGVYMSKAVYNNAKELGIIDRLTADKVRIYINLPYVVRSDFNISEFLCDVAYDGLYIRNLDGFACVAEHFTRQELSELDITCAGSLYAYNREAVSFIRERIPGVVFESPAELNMDELYRLSNNRLELLVYGYQRVMLSAQCVQNSKFGCDRAEGVIKLKDDRNNVFYAKAYCEECLGLIYNGIPYSFIDNLTDSDKLSPVSHKIDFTIEDGALVNRIIEIYSKNAHLDMLSTTGHMFRGVE